VCEALNYLHSRQPPIIHRDIKPANLILTAEGQVILVDFGIAKVGDLQQMTLSGARGVTPGYSPLEQYGMTGTDAQSDIYSLAATAYTLLTGMIPADAMAVTMGEVETPKPVHLVNPQIPVSVSRAIEAGMRLKRTDRVRSVASFLKALQEGAAPEAWTQSREILAIAYMQRGLDLLTSQDVENGLTAFEQAKAKGADISSNAEEIAKACVLRAKDIIQSCSNPQDKVIWLLERARALAGNHPEICSNLGATLTQKGIMLNNSKNFAEAEKFIRRAKQLSPDDDHTRKTASIIFSNQALEFAKLNQKDKAIALMTESVEADPEYTGGNPAHEARSILMTWMMVAGSDEIAQKNFDNGIRIMKDALNYLNDPEARKRISTVLHNKGVDLINNEQYDQGINYLLEALSYNDNTDTRKVLAQAYILRAAQKFQRSDRYDAIRDADEALRYDPYNRDIRDVRNRLNY
jgi:tetratricopeptide (TPR) repeat protein